ncbi:MAG: tRNA (adenosine(37)-N6)-dimethylallyltransferase MiaA [Rhizobiaceae bacterium]|nr:tRNA (adenosine(37)-N6)-dimethylallyltransferase MiaA [Rhizobiaceae bacterium]
MGEGRLFNAVLIAGPTASGKSALALETAERTGGVIINTDSMQGYAVLDVLTARPGPADLARAPHALYGHVPPATPYSTGAWLRDVMRLIDDGTLRDRVGIFVGGTGLYFRALLGGIAEMPEIPAHIRDRWRYHLLEDGSSKLHSILQREDPETAATLKPSDGQRIARALEVLEGSGRSIRYWQSVRGKPLVDAGSARKSILEVPRPALVTRIGRRLDAMVAQGALDEVASLLRLNLDPGLPAMKAIGVREFSAVLRGEIEISEALMLAKVATAQYAKRQVTWFRHQMDESWQRHVAVDKPFER